MAEIAKKVGRPKGSVKKPQSSGGVFHDYCPPVIYVPDEAVSAYRAIGGNVWTNQSWSTNIIQPISNR